MQQCGYNHYYLAPWLGQARLELVDINSRIIFSIEDIQHTKDVILLVVNPVDVMSISWRFQPSAAKIFGSGTVLDTSVSLPSQFTLQADPRNIRLCGWRTRRL